MLRTRSAVGAIVNQMKVTVLGGGNMGAAFARALSAKGIVAKGDLFVVESNSERRNTLQGALDCVLSENLAAVHAQCTAVLLAVKPQDAEVACAALRNFLRPEQLVISIMAGVPLARLSTLLNNHTLLVRSMPNLPGVIAQGMTVYATHPALTERDLALAEKLLNALGAALWVRDEDLIDAATAISGTGPAYIYYFLEHMLRASEELGFSRSESELLLENVFHGAVNLWKKGIDSPEKLRAMVTSPGGTTAAAVKVFDEGKLGETLKSGIRAAHARSKSLSGCQ